VTESLSTTSMASPNSWVRAAVLIVGAALICALSLFSGSSDVSPAQALSALVGHADEAARSVMMEVRVPRLLAAFGVGSVLALAGVLLQALFRNPLADPYVLGVSGGAAVCALLAMIGGATLWMTQSAAIAGALLAVVLVYVLGRGGGTSRLLLTGVVFASACGAFVSVLLAVADSSRVRGMIFWLAGDLDWASNPHASWVSALIAVVAGVVLARPLNVLASGEIRARSVGLDFDTWRAVVFTIAATLTAIAVVSAGTVGFVGLITPHMARLFFRTTDHRVVAPASALLGGTLLTAADLAARTVASPRQLPVGAIMALVGAPLFIVLLRRGGRSVH
jgi:iron complex transport system permease protein